MTSSRRRFLLASGAVAATSLAGCLADGSSDLPDEAPDTAVTGAPVPDSPGDYEYETMGSGDNPMAVYFGNWKCPHCATFSTNALNTIVSDYVQPGNLDLQFRAWTMVPRNGELQPFLGPDAVRAGHAGLAVWNVAPDRYWTFHEYVMQNQPAESQEWATTDWLVTAAEKSGVSDVDAVRSQIDDEAYTNLLERTVTDAIDAGYSATPTLVVDGQSVSPMDGDDGLPQSTRDVLDSVTSG